MKVEMTRKELISFNDTLKALARIRETRFAYVIAKNKRTIKDELDALEEARQAPDGYEEYEKQRVRLVTKHAVKDPDGNPIFLPNGATRIRNEIEFEAEFNKLREEHREAVELGEAKEKELQEFLKEKISFDLHAVDVKYLPKDLSSDEMETLMPIIDGNLDDLFLDPDPS